LTYCSIIACLEILASATADSRILSAQGPQGTWCCKARDTCFAPVYSTTILCLLALTANFEAALHSPKCVAPPSPPTSTSLITPPQHTHTYHRNPHSHRFPRHESFTMASSQESIPTSSLPAVPIDPTVTTPSPSHEREIQLGGQSSEPTSDEDSRPTKLQRPKIGSRKSSRTLIIPRDSPYVEIAPEGDPDENEMRAMSPRRSSEECQKLGREARDALVE